MLLKDNVDCVAYLKVNYSYRKHFVHCIETLIKIR